MLSSRRLRHVLPTLPLITVRGPWYRAVNFDSLVGPPSRAPAGSPPQPLWAGGAARRGARFTPRATVSPGGAVTSIDCLYLAEDEMTPLLEVTGVLRPAGSPIPLFFEPQVMMTVDGVLSDILDLASPATQSALGTTAQALTGSWQLQQSTHLAGLGPLPPTQLLAQSAFRVGAIVGMRYPSSKNPSGHGLVVFTARLVAGRHVLRVHNRPMGRLQGSIP